MGLHVLKACALAALALSAAAHAQVYPAKPLRMIVAYPPGGGTDIVGRMLAQKLGESLGQSVVVENRGGASGNIGTELAARAAPDGYTVLMGNVAPNAINVSLFKDLPFDLDAEHPCGAPVDPGKDRQRSDRARQGRAGNAQLRLRGRGQFLAPRGRAVP